MASSSCVGHALHVPNIRTNHRSQLIIRGCYRKNLEAVTHTTCGQNHGERLPSPCRCLLKVPMCSSNQFYFNQNYYELIEGGFRPLWLSSCTGYRQFPYVHVIGIPSMVQERGIIHLTGDHIIPLRMVLQSAWCDRSSNH